MGLIDSIKKVFTRELSPSNKAYAMGLDCFLTQNSAGEIVSPETALGIAAYYAAIRCISEDLSKLPLRVFKDNGETRKALPNHPLQRLLDWPNEEMTPMSFRETLLANALGTGAGYAEIIRNGQGQPIAMYPLCPHDVQILRVNGSIKYRVYIRQGQYNPEVAAGASYVELDHSDVLHIRGLGYDGITSYRLSQIARNTLGVALALDRFSGSYFRSGAHPSGIFVHPQHLSPDAHTNLRRALEHRYTGAENAHKVMVLEEGLTYTPISANPESAQLSEMKQMSIDEIARLFRVPAHKLNSMAHSTFSNIESQSIEFITDCLSSWAVRIEQEIERKLTSPNVNDVVAVHDFDSLLRGDSASRAALYQSGLTYGWLNVNEVRARENLPPIENGDNHFVPANLISLDKALEPAPAPVAPAMPQEGAPTEPTPAPAAPNASQRASLKLLLMDALTRTLKIERSRIEGGKPAGDVVDAMAVERALRAGVNAAAAMYGKDPAPVLKSIVSIHVEDTQNHALLEGSDMDHFMARAYSEAESILYALESN